MADREGKMSGSDLEALALAAFFAARSDVELEVKERAFKRHEAGGTACERPTSRSMSAYNYAGKHSISSAWIRRAEGIIGEEGDTYAHGYLALIRTESVKGVAAPVSFVAIAWT